jgi:hypothetical protein
MIFAMRIVIQTKSDEDRTLMKATWKGPFSTPMNHPGYSEGIWIE